MKTASLWGLVDARVAAQLRRRARTVRGVLSHITTGGRALVAQLAARADEVAPDVEVAQHYGFAGVCPAGTEAIAVPVGASSAHLVVVGELDRANRPTDLEAGDVAVYAASGARVWLRSNGDIEITPAAGGQVLIAGGGPACARVGDTVTPDAAFATWLTAAATALQGLAGVPLPTGTSSSISTGSSQVEVG